MRLTPLAFRGGAAYSRYGAMGDPGLDHYLAGLDTALQQLLAQVEGTQIELTKVRETLQQQGRSKDYHRHNDTSTTTSSSANLHNNINQAEGTKVTSASDGSPSSAKDKREEKEREKEEGHGKKVQVSRSPDAVHSIILTDNGTDLPKTPIQRRRTEEDRYNTNNVALSAGGDSLLHQKEAGPAWQSSRLQISHHFFTLQKEDGGWPRGDDGGRGHDTIQETWAGLRIFSSAVQLLHR